MSLEIHYQDGDFLPGILFDPAFHYNFVHLPPAALPSSFNGIPPLFHPLGIIVTFWGEVLNYFVRFMIPPARIPIKINPAYSTMNFIVRFIGILVIGVLEILCCG